MLLSVDFHKPYLFVSGVHSWERETMFTVSRQTLRGEILKEARRIMGTLHSSHNYNAVTTGFGFCLQ